MNPWISTIGLYNTDNTIFRTMALPDGIDRETVVHSILWETAELEILLTTPEAFKFAIKAWSNKRLPTWERILKALEIEYNPIENYYRETDIHGTSEKNGEFSEAGNSRLDTDGNNILSKTGYNSGDWQKTDKNEYENTDIGTSSKSGDNNEDEEHNERIVSRGNIGVRSNQELLEQEILLAEHNLVEIIVQEFKENFCLMVY